MLVGYSVILDIHVGCKKPPKPKYKKGKIVKPENPEPRVRRFEARWTGTFIEFPDRDLVVRAVMEGGVADLNTENRPIQAGGHKKLGIAQVVKQMPQWPARDGDYGNDFITIRIRSLPIFGTPPAPVVPAAVQQVAAQMDAERAEKDSAPSMGEAVPNGKSLVCDSGKDAGQEVHEVQPEPTAAS